MERDTCEKCGGSGTITGTADLGDEHGSRFEESMPCDCADEPNRPGRLELGPEGCAAADRIFDLTGEVPWVDDAGPSAGLPGWVGAVLGDEIIGSAHTADEAMLNGLAQVEKWQAA